MTEVENVEVEEVERVESVEAIRVDYEKEESRKSIVLLRVNTKFLQTRNLTARRIIGNTPASALASPAPTLTAGFWPDAGITHQEVTAIAKIAECKRRRASRYLT